MDTKSFPGISRTEQPGRAPSPPYIHIPSTLEHHNVITLNPITNLDDQSVIFDVGLDSHLTRDELNSITRGRTQTALRTQWWTYEARRQAQQILDFLYLGPASVARDHAFLRGEGITMLLAARDTRQAQARLLAVEKSARELGIAADYVDVSSQQELIGAIPLAVGKINSHLLEKGGHGKVLVCCETGNERSAALVAAYIMTVYEADLVRALQFIHYKRFCTNFDDDIKFLLRSYGDIIAARRMVRGGEPRQENAQLLALPPDAQPRAKSKRSIDDTMDVEDAQDDGQESDLQRFTGRNVTPFVDDDAMGQEG